MELRTYLEHFDQTGHLGSTEAIAEIKHRLNQRIREVEAQIRVAKPEATNDSEYRAAS